MDRRLSFRFLTRYVGGMFLLEPAADVLCGRLGSLGRLRLQNLFVLFPSSSLLFPRFWFLKLLGSAMKVLCSSQQQTRINDEFERYGWSMAAPTGRYSKL